MNEHQILEEQMSQVARESAELNAGIAQRQQEIQQAQQRISQLNEQIFRNQGAIAYGQLLLEKWKARLQQIMPTTDETT